MKHRDKILELRSQGKSYDEIVSILGCSKGTVSFHCGKQQKEKTRNRRLKSRSLAHPYIRKIENFSQSHINPKVRIPTHKTRTLIKLKIDTFSRGSDMSYNKPMFTVQDVIEKFGTEPKCYLTGQIIDINKPRTYAFDHIVPRSRGGDNSIDNLGLCTIQANQSKSVMTHDEFVNFCKQVLEHHNYDVKAPQVGSDPTPSI